MPRHATGRKRKPDPHATVTVFKVALTGDNSIWRRIAICSDQTLDDLHAAIFDAYDRFDEHLYSFHLQPLYARRGPDRNRDNLEYTSPVEIEDARRTPNTKFMTPPRPASRTCHPSRGTSSTTSSTLATVGGTN
jgi:hypothetical protein